MTRIWGRRMILGVAAAALTVSGALGATVQEIKDRGILRAGVAAFNMAGFMEIQGDQKTGFDVDLATKIAEKLGVKLEFVPLPWQGGVDLAWNPSYGWDTFDMVLAAITIKEERAAVCDFSEWYFTTGQMALVRSDTPFAKTDDLKGKKVAVLGGSTGEKVAQETLGAHVVAMPSLEEIAQAVKDKQVDGAVLDGSTVLLMVKNDAELKSFDDALTKERYGVALPKGNAELKALVDDVVKAERKELYNTWFK